jgi:hypothetical protein
VMGSRRIAGNAATRAWRRDTYRPGRVALAGPGPRAVLFHPRPYMP